MSNSQLPPVHRYLWAQGATRSPLAVGSYLAERYRVVDFPLLLDTQPQLPPPPLDEVPPSAVPYLALSPFSIAIPRPFTQVMHPDGTTPLLLLEEVPLQGTNADAPPSLLPTLAATWPQASALEQLTWLWQLAKLWQPCCDQQVAHCLLAEELVRVDGEDIRLLSLQAQATAPTLMDLGQHWRSLIPTAVPTIRDYLNRLTDRLITEPPPIREVVYALVMALEHQAAQHPLQVQLATYSDQGPTRQRNEDACFPPSGAAQTLTLPAGMDSAHPPAPLVVVCDGVGGHEGGDVASQSAIAEVTEQLHPLLVSDHRSHGEIVTAVKQAILAANQVIVERNDADQRRDRGRMGTTIVMALVYGGRLYIAHLGDSRAYRVRSQDCRQLTLDDDVAAREMRLGLELYQDALQNPGSGALVQALGMASAQHLHPTVKLYPIAHDSLILLCSDGLSDHDLVDRVWSAELLPVLRGDRAVAAAAQKLITLANTYNGHDNVTLGLLRVSPQMPTAIAPVPAAFAVPSPHCTDTPDAEPISTRTTIAPAAVATARPATAATRPFRAKTLPWLMTSVLVAGLIGIISALSWQWWSRRSAVVPPVDTDVPEGGILSPSATPPTSQNLRDGSLAVGDYLQIQPLPDPSSAATLITTTSPPGALPAAAVDSPRRVLAVGSVVKVNSRQQTPDGQLWVRLQVCSAATPPAPSPREPAVSSPPESSPNEGRDRLIPLALPGDQGWLLQSEIPTFAEQLLDTSSSQQGLCID